MEWKRDSPSKEVQIEESGEENPKEDQKSGGRGAQETGEVDSGTVPHHPPSSFRDLWNGQKNSQENWKQDCQGHAGVGSLSIPTEADSKDERVSLVQGDSLRRALHLQDAWKLWIPSPEAWLQ